MRKKYLSVFTYGKQSKRPLRFYGGAIFLFTASKMDGSAQNSLVLPRGGKQNQVSSNSHTDL
jgi:hypothetical protein